MGEEEDRMAPRPSTSTSQPVYTHQFEFGSPNLDHHPHHMPYPLASNLDDFIRDKDSFRVYFLFVTQIPKIFDS
ncbi:hypothetical protein I3842_03G100300 [Carya illinoinensis]|uniref:Uncharacterized protein n=1 Tax=Carya illinoinensis TaxID=32201 RepID=A0A922FIG8_CARIL|nr:hypothetical protein I3842_03G100300 [Carya illinoinensis]